MTTMAKPDDLEKNASMHGSEPACNTSTTGSMNGDTSSSSSSSEGVNLGPAAHDVSSSSSTSIAQRILHQLAASASAAAAASPSSQSVYSPSGCKYSRLGVDVDDGFDDNDHDDADHNNDTSGSRNNADAPPQQPSLDHDSSPPPQPVPSSSSSPSSASYCSWKVLATTVALAACIHLAYLAGYHNYLNDRRERLDSAGVADNSSSSSSLSQSSPSSNQYPYPNYPLNYVPPPEPPAPESTTGSDGGTGKYKNGRSHPKVFVCITGQLPRLELANKIQNLFLPWITEHDVEFDIALVLTDTNHKSVQRMEERDQEYYSVQEVYDALDNLHDTKINILNNDVDVQSQNPVLNPHYTNQRAQDTTMTPAQVIERVQNHVRQFESLAVCHHHLSQSSDTLSPESYDIIHRIREDSGYYRPPDFVHIHDVITAHPMTILSSDCQFHGGINDRGSFVSGDAAYDYFVLPIVDMYTRPLPKDVRNTEQFLMVTYGHTCRLVQSDSFQIFRLWEKVDDDADADDDNESGNSGGNADGTGTHHVAEMEFSRSDLKCLEDKGRGDPNHLSTTTRWKFCHDYSDGYSYCIFFDKAGVSYYPGKAGLLRDTDDDEPSARLREDWVPPAEDEEEEDESKTMFDVLDIGWDASATGQVDTTVLKIKTDEDIIKEKKAKRKKKRKDWDKKHNKGDDGDGK